MTAPVEISAVIPVTERFDEVEPLYEAYKRGVEAAGLSAEFIYVLDGEFPEVLKALLALRERGERIKIVRLAKWFGEATVLSIGFEAAAGEIILTLPAYRQIDPAEIPRLVGALDNCDMAIARRYPRRDAKINMLQSSVFHFLLKTMVDVPFHDLGCGVRAIRRAVVEEVALYGDQHRFLPLLAYRQGFKIVELDAKQAEEDRSRRVYAPGVYLRRLLDILSIVFIVKFTKKPLRFFGLVGAFLMAAGTAGTAYLSIEKIFFGTTLADRPALLLAALLMVLGFQMIAVGLIGELIIFTHAKELKEYTIDEIIE